MRRILPNLVMLVLLACFLPACAGANQSYSTSFDSAGSWRTGDDTYTEGSVHDGVYDLFIKGDDISRWSAAGQAFGDGRYQVEATQIEGPLDNGYGMLIRADPQAGDFYLFKVSGDGYVWIGRYAGEAEQEVLVGEHWFESPAVRQGLNQTNTLRIDAESGNLIFYVNDQQVGRATNNAYQRGDIGVFAQTLGQGGVRVHFDNFSVAPLAD